MLSNYIEVSVQTKVLCVEKQGICGVDHINSGISGKMQAWGAALRIYTQPKVAGMMVLGFSAGLPILLVFGTLSFWLSEAGVERSTIGFFSWVGLAYAFKWIWSPLVDRLPLPVLRPWLGRRRSWLLFAQCMIMLSLIGMGMTDPADQLTYMALFAVMVAFFSATQDIALDAYRIEAVDDAWQGAMAGSYMLGYRIGMIVASAGALGIAAWFDLDEQIYSAAPWQKTYLIMAALMLIGMLSTLMTREPAGTDVVEADHADLQGFQAVIAWIKSAVIAPFREFFQRYAWRAFLILALIGTYRVSDIVLGIMANPFYNEMGFTKAEVASVTKVFGVIMTIVGALWGGVLVVRYGVLKILLLGAVLAAISNVCFSLLAQMGNDLNALMVVISIDNLSAGIATAAFVAFLSGLTNRAYSATQYALFTSIMALFPKFIAGFSGVAVDSVGYAQFFIGTALLGVPVLLLILLCMRYVPNLMHGNNP